MAQRRMYPVNVARHPVSRLGRFARDPGPGRAGRAVQAPEQQRQQQRVPHLRQGATLNPQARYLTHVGREGGRPLRPRCQRIGGTTTGRRDSTLSRISEVLQPPASSASASPARQSVNPPARSLTMPANRVAATVRRSGHPSVHSMLPPRRIRSRSVALSSSWAKRAATTGARTESEVNRDSITDRTGGCTTSIAYKYSSTCFAGASWAIALSRCSLREKISVSKSLRRSNHPQLPDRATADELTTSATTRRILDPPLE